DAGQPQPLRRTSRGAAARFHLCRARPDQDRHGGPPRRPPHAARRGDSATGRGIGRPEGRDGGRPAATPVVHRHRGRDDRQVAARGHRAPAARPGDRAATARKHGNTEHRSLTAMSSRTRRMTMAVAGAAAISLLAGGSSSSAGGGTTSSPASSASPSVSVVAGGSCSSGATKILFWAWVPGMGRAVTEFNKTHPNICVTQEDVGAGDPQYVAITNALKAGSGAPDVAEIEFDELPSFEVTKN